MQFDVTVKWTQKFERSLSVEANTKEEAEGIVHAEFSNYPVVRAEWIAASPYRGAEITDIEAVNPADARYKAKREGA
jgi:hypothetical protein